MPMSMSSHIGIFQPDEIEAMRLEFAASSSPDESQVQREERAAEIIARFQAHETCSEPPRP